MTQQDIISLCTTEFHFEFAPTAAKALLQAGGVEMLWRTLSRADTLGLDKKTMERLLFRGSYIFDHIYFGNTKEFDPFIDDFFDFFPRITNESMKRHFAKICNHLLHKRGLRPANLREICEIMMDWVIDPKVKIAVKGWAMDTIARLASEERWIEELMPELLESISNDRSPGAQSLLRYITRKGFAASKVR